MYCKFCGGPIDRKTMRCFDCGSPVGPLSGGNSFKEAFAGGKAAGTAEQSNPPSRPKRHAIGLLLCSILCLIGILGIFLGLKTQHSISQLRDAFSLMTKEQAEQLQAISDRITPVQQANSAAEGQSSEGAFQITKDPESENDFRAEQTRVAFICRAAGEDLSFSWIKYNDRQNSWDTLENGDLYEIVNLPGESTLKVKSASRQHEGTYICIVSSGETGVLYSAPAQLSLSKASAVEDAQEPEPQSEDPQSDPIGTMAPFTETTPSLPSTSRDEGDESIRHG